MRYKIVKMQNSKELHGTDFVGVSESEERMFQVTVPYGVIIPDYVSDTDEKDMRFLKRYVKSIQKALNSARVKNALEQETLGLKNPLSGVKIVCDYITMGPIIEYDDKEQVSRTGKMNFQKTMKNVVPLYINGDFIFEKYVISKKSVNSETFLLQVQGSIINHFMQNGGELIFGSKLKVFTNSVKLDKKIIGLLRRELNQTFNSRKQNLIRWMIEYINGIDITEEKGKWNYAIIASTLWEVMVNTVFGNQVKTDKTLYGKRYAFCSLKTGVLSKPGKATQHDTIYEDYDSIFIIDAKMYGAEENLLTEEVLGKQFGYYIEAKKKQPHKMIVNILFMPTVEGEDSGFSDNIITDPHTDRKTDPDKIIFIYKYSANQLIEDYYFSKKRIGQIKTEFEKFLKLPYVIGYITKDSKTDSRIFTYAQRLEML